MLAQLRKNFPSTVTSDTVKRLGLASNNESYVISAITFIGLLDEEGKKTDEAAKVFSISNDESFHESFVKLIEKAYIELFELHGENAWELDDSELLDFFRQADQTSETIGKRQVKTFRIFSGFAGKDELPDLSKKPSRSTKKAAPKKSQKPNEVNINSTTAKKPQAQNQNSDSTKNDVAITVRVEVNLPPNGDQKTYDAIFSSIRKNLMNG